VEQTESPVRFETFDAHNDSIILREVRGDPMDFADADPAYHVDLPRLRQGRINAICVMVGDHHVLQSLRLIDSIHAMCAAHPAVFALCLDAEEIRTANRSGRIALVMSIEGQVMFAERLENVRNWYRLGVRMASLTHGEGRFGGSPHALQIDRAYFGYLSPAQRETHRRQSKGLTPFARASLDEMARLGIVCDLAHTNDKAFWEALDYARGPVCVSHGNCYALCPHSRNCTDDMLKALAARGGVVGLSFFRNFIDPQRPTLDRLADHFLHAVEVMGPDHVGVGSDFDGLPTEQAPMIEDAAGMNGLWEALSRRGLSESALNKISRENLIRLFEKT